MSSPDRWDGTERRHHVVDHLVVEAAKIAAQDVAAIHRRRLVTQAFLAGLVAACLVTVPVTLVVNHQRANDARAFARFNCHRTDTLVAVTASTKDVFARFIKSDAALREDQRDYTHRAEVEQALHRIIAPKVLRDIEAQSLARDRAATKLWRKSLLPELDAARRRLETIRSGDCPRRFS